MESERLFAIARADGTEANVVMPPVERHFKESVHARPAPSNLDLSAVFYGRSHQTVALALEMFTQPELDRITSAATRADKAQVMTNAAKRLREVQQIHRAGDVTVTTERH